MKSTFRTVFHLAALASAFLLLGLTIWRLFGQPRTRYIGIMTNGRRPLPLYELTFDFLNIPFAFWTTAAAILPSIWLTGALWKRMSANSAGYTGRCANN